MNITFEGKKCERKTTLKLQPGDVIQEGNQFMGFYYVMVMSVERSKYNKHKATVVRMFDFMAQTSDEYGFSTVFYVVKDETK